MKSFLYAFRGIAAALKTQRHMRIHFCFAFYVLLTGAITELEPLEWAAVLLCIALVISLELVNTAVESLGDELSREYSKRIGMAKDCAAGAVLTAAVISAITGCVIFLSDGRPEKLLAFAGGHKPAAGAIVLSLPLWIYYVMKKRRS